MGSASGSAEIGSLRRAGVLWRSTLDGVLIRPLGATEVIKLGGTGQALWAALEHPATLESLVADLAGAHDADPAVIEADLRPVIDDLVARGAVESAASQGTDG